MADIPVLLGLRGFVVAVAIVLAAGCASIPSAPINEPLPEGAISGPAAPAAATRENSIIVSLSGGGLRAAAFAQGVLLALESRATPTGDLLDDVSVISSVSGSSLTAAYFGLYGREGIRQFRERVLLPGFESDLQLSLTRGTCTACLEPA